MSLIAWGLLSELLVFSGRTTDCGIGGKETILPILTDDEQSIVTLQDKPAIPLY